MDLAFTAEEDAFRAKVRRWLRDNLPPGWGADSQEPEGDDERVAFRMAWERRLHAGGWGGISWPKDCGGAGLGLVEQAIFEEESARANAPEGINHIGRNLVGPVLMAHGTPAQKDRYLGPIVRAEELWCQGFSEPNAGSDLASLGCKADDAGDHFVVNGQKLWTSYAQYARWCLLLVRTGSVEARHRGLSVLLVDLGTPGITIRPLVRINGQAGFAEVFYEDVRVPRANLVGQVNEGWRVALSALTSERGAGDAIARQVRMKHLLLRALREHAGGGSDAGSALKESYFRQKLAQRLIDLEIMRLNCYRAFSPLLEGRPPGPEVATHKLFWSHAYQRVTQTLVELQGAGGISLAQEQAAPWATEYLSSRAATIYSGTSEIQRNIIGERILALPR